MGQFHSDFEPPKFYPGTKVEAVIDKSYYPRSIETVIIGKKFYSHLVEYRCKKYDHEQKKITDEWEELTYYHNRLKGVPKSISSKMTTSDYLELYKGEEKEFDLLEGGKKVRFQFDPKCNRTVNYTNFTRTVKRNIPTSEETVEDFAKLEEKRKMERIMY